ncbi:MAG: hypothetical protein PHU51_04470 [Candidatus Nanoarchaeia archaeon]|nr:hypothetical protein [Candidatus Nanoarchaeia archaeon]
MAKEIQILHWTTSKGFKKGELVLQKEGIFIYKTAKTFTRGATEFRDIVYAEIPFDAINTIELTKTGLTKRHSLKISLNKEAFEKILHENHSYLFKHLTKLFNRKNILYLPVLGNTYEEIRQFTHLVKEHMR